jgi:hypothetical protein
MTPFLLRNSSTYLKDKENQISSSRIDRGVWQGPTPRELNDNGADWGRHKSSHEDSSKYVTANNNK